MDVLPLLFAALGLTGLGAFVTINLARHVPLDVLAHARDHGRFAHLDGDQPRSGPAHRVPVAGRPVATGLRTA